MQQALEVPTSLNVVSETLKLWAWPIAIVVVPELFSKVVYKHLVKLHSVLKHHLHD